MRNPGGHSSVPLPENAIYTLAEGLVRLAKFTFPVAINPVTRAFFEQTARIESPEIAAAMKAIAANSADASAARTLCRVPRFASMLRTTCVATRLSAGHAENALPQTASANVNCRIAPTSSAAETWATLARVLSDTAIAITFADSVRDDFRNPRSPWSQYCSRRRQR